MAYAHETFYADLIGFMKLRSEINVLVGAEIYLERFPPGMTKPVLTVETFDSEVGDFLGGDDPGIAMITVLFSCWSTVALEALQLRDAIFDVWKDFTGNISTGTGISATIFRGDITTEQRPDSQLFRRMLRFEFWYTGAFPLTATIQDEQGADLLGELLATPLRVEQAT